MANIDIEQRPKANILPWLIGLAILVVVVGWLLWRNNRIPDVQGRLETPEWYDALGADPWHVDEVRVALQNDEPLAVEPDTRAPA